MFKTKNDIPEATRGKVVELLNARLADCIDLQTQTKQAHWNVKGPSFIALHELFDKVNEAVEEYVDDLAHVTLIERHTPHPGGPVLPTGPTPWPCGCTWTARTRRRKARGRTTPAASRWASG